MPECGVEGAPRGATGVARQRGGPRVDGRGVISCIYLILHPRVFPGDPRGRSLPRPSEHHSVTASPWDLKPGKSRQSRQGGEC